MDNVRKKQALNFNESVWRVVQKIPKGRVATYGMIAGMIGKPRAARAVGTALKKNLYRDARLSKSVPCHRVVCSDGRIGGFARGTQAKLNLLNKEGVKIINQKVDLKHIIIC